MHNSQVAEPPDHLGLVQHVCSNLHAAVARHILEEFEQLLLAGGHSVAGCVNLVSLELPNLQNSESTSQMSTVTLAAACRPMLHQIGFCKGKALHQLGQASRLHLTPCLYWIGCLPAV